MNRLIAAGVVLIAALYVLVSSIYVVNEREQAVVMRFGQITDVKTEPGLYFKIPTSIVDSVQIVEDRLLRLDLPNMTVQVSGGQFYDVDAFLTYRINNARLFRERVQGNLDVAESRMATRFDAALRQVYGLRDFDDALSEERPAMMRETRDLIAGEMAQLGIEIVDVRILRTELRADVSQQTFERMKAERLAEAALLRGRGDEAARTIRAQADRLAVETTASAQRDADILRGEGEGERSRIFAEAYGLDPEFFEFYRSMQSYQQALAGATTTMVLSPSSEFFNYFGSDTPAGVTITPADQLPVAPPPPALSVEPATDLNVETTELMIPVDDLPAVSTPAVEAPAVGAPPAAEPAPAVEAVPATPDAVAPAP
ncbi:MAG: protease modulator HflC [Devosia sp.]|nr:protease modulator HflC [Devosia sp.]